MSRLEVIGALSVIVSLQRTICKPCKDISMCWGWLGASVGLELKTLRSFHAANRATASHPGRERGGLACITLHQGKA